MISRRRISIIGLTLLTVAGVAAVGVTTATGFMEMLRAGKPAAPQAVNLSANKTDALIVDTDGDGKADPGDKIRYTVTVSSSPGHTGVQFDDMIDANTMLVGGSTNVSPLAFDDSYDTIGNTLLKVGVAASTDPEVVVPGGSLFNNDTEFLGDTFTLKSVEGVNFVAVSVTAATEQGGSVTVNANGSFSYLPPAGFSGVDNFDYVITDDGVGGLNPLTGPGRVTLNVLSVVWYVKNNAAAGGDGRSTQPFDTLLEAETASASNQTIYVFQGDGTTTGQNAGITLKNGQRLVGEGVALTMPVSVNGGPNPTTLRAAGTKPRVNNAAGNGAQATDAIPIEIVGLSLSGSLNAIDLTLTGAFGGSGTMAIKSNTIFSAGAEGVDINMGGTGTLTMDVQDNIWTTTAASHVGNGFDARRTLGALRVTFTNNTNITSSATGVFIDGSAGGLASTHITGFASNTVHQNTVGTGMNIANATFDATPGGAFNQVSGGITTVGVVGDGVGGSGIVMTTVAGDLAFTDLDIVASGGAGLQMVGTGTVNIGAGTGMQIVVSPSVSTIAATGGPALDISSLTANLPFVSLTSTNSATTGIRINTVADTVSGTTATVTNSAGVGVQLLSNTASVSFGTLAVTTASGTGLFGSNNAGAISVTTAAGSSITATGGAAIDITNAAGTPFISLNFASLTTTNSPLNGINVDRVGGTGLTVTGATTIDMAPGSSNGIDLTNMSTTTVSLSTASTVAVNDRRASGVFVDTASGTIGLGTTTIPNPNAAGGYGIRVEDSSAAVTVASATIGNTVQTSATSDAGSDGIPDTDGDGDAIFLKTNTGSFTLNGGSLTALATDGIDIRSSQNLTVVGVTIDEIGSSSTNVTSVDDSGIFAIDLSGTNLVQNSTISHFDGTVTGGAERGIKMRNQGVNFTLLRVDNTDFTNNAALGIRGDDAILVEGYGAVTGKVVVEDTSTFSGLSGEGVQVNAGNNVGSGTMEVDILDSTFQNPVNPGGFGGIAIASAGNNGSGSVGTANLDIEIRGNTLTNLHPGNANAGTIFLTPFSRGTFKAVVDDNDMTGPGAPGRGAIRVSTGDLADEELQTFSLVINDNRIDNFGDDGIFIDIRGESLTTGGNAGQVEITNNAIGQTTRVGQDGIEGITFRCRTSPILVGAKTVNLLVNNNTVRNNDNSVGDETMDLDAEDACTINATVTSNVFTSNGSAQDEFRATTEAAASVMCLDLRNNTATQGAGPAGNGSLTVEELLGTMSLRHSGNSPAPTIVGGVTIIAGGCTLPVP